VEAQPLEESVRDHVVNQLQAQQPFLRSARIDGREPEVTEIPLTYQGFSRERAFSRS